MIVIGARATVRVPRFVVIEPDPLDPYALRVRLVKLEEVKWRAGKTLSALSEARFINPSFYRSPVIKRLAKGVRARERHPLE